MRNPLGPVFEAKPWLTSPMGEILIGDVPAREAAAEWERQRASFSETGRWPVIVSVDGDLRLRTETFEAEGEAAAGSIESARGLDPLQVLENRRASQLPDEEDDDFEEEIESLEFDFDPTQLDRYEAGPWQENLQMLIGVSGSVKLALVPVRAPYEVPAVLAFGNWNDCPPNEEHVAILKYWHDRFGAEPVVMTSDFLELRIARPVRDPQIAKEVAVTHFAYAPDSFETLPDFAQAVLDREVWSFWWD